MAQMPLHVAAGYDKVDIVKYLLEWKGPKKVDLESLSMEGLTPLNHIFEGPGSEKLRELLGQHIKEQRKAKALKACSDAKEKMKQFEAAMANIVGLHSLSYSCANRPRECFLMRKEEP